MTSQVLFKRGGYEVRYTGCSGVGSIANEGGSTRFIQGTANVHSDFDRVHEHDLMDLMSSFEVYRVECAPGSDKAIVLGSKITRMQSLFVDIGKVAGLIVVPLSVMKEDRFTYAIDYVSRINLALSGKGYQVALIDEKGRVKDSIDHIETLEDVEEVAKYYVEASEGEWSENERSVTRWASRLAP